MPRYFFDIVDHDGITRDPEGTELPGPAMAMQEARDHAREMLADSLRAGKKVDGRRFDISDENGTVIATFAFRDLLS
jgi:hypothetical protein